MDKFFGRWPRFRATRRATACLVLSASTAIALTGCSDKPRPGEQISGNGSRGFSSAISSWTDPETGCRYLIYDRKSGYAGMGGITPRLGGDGNPICRDAPLSTQTHNGE